MSIEFRQFYNMRQTLYVDENVALLSLDQFACVEAGRIDAGPSFSVLLTLWPSTMQVVGFDEVREGHLAGLAN